MLSSRRRRTLVTIGCGRMPGHWLLRTTSPTGTDFPSQATESFDPQADFSRVRVRFDLGKAFTPLHHGSVKLDGRPVKH